MDKLDIALISFLVVITLLGIVSLILIFCLPKQNQSLEKVQKQQQDVQKVQKQEEKTPSTFITFSKLGNHGGMGNQLFQIAATIGIGHHLNKQVILPETWKYRNMFLINDQPKIKFQNVEKLKKDAIFLPEKRCFLFEDTNLLEHKDKNIDLYGFRQNVGYFNIVAPEVRDAFEFNPEVSNKIKSQIQANAIGIHVRRGDYVLKQQQKDAHEICTLEYYQNSLKYFKSKYPDAPVYIFSDDIPWCKLNFSNSNDVIFSTYETEIEDFIALSLCRFKIISNSTFSWWAAWLDARHDSEVLIPTPWIRGQDEDYQFLYEKNWHVYDIATNQFTFATHWDFNLKIGAYYQCFQQPKAFLHSIHSFRRVYPTATLILVNDDGDNYKHVSDRYHVTKYSVNASRGGNGITTTSTSLSYAYTCVKNLILGAKEIKEEYFCLLEDDTNMVRAIEYDFNKQVKQKFAIIANSQSPMPDKIYEYLKQNYKSNIDIYTGNGGCLFLSSFWANLDLLHVEHLISEFSSLIEGFFFDILLSFICIANGGLISGKNKYQVELTEYRSRLGCLKSPGLLHTYKDLYNLPLSKQEKILLRPILTTQNANYFKIAIVGPGEMSIPPKGWGAVEILIWNYAKELEKLGHVVCIVNDKTPKNILQQLKEFHPHFVHIQYDNFAYLASEISTFCYAVAITSHFGYIEQPDRWGTHYGPLVDNLVDVMKKHSSVYNFTLSQGITDLFVNKYKMQQRVCLTPNGADSNAFKYSTTPKYPNRTICVGKIETRKRQSELQHNKDIWFAGNRYGVEFNYKSSNYLGEWTKPMLYENLTDYGNLVLLSDGEADPLVIKEALVAGLGIVTNKWSIANLDLSKPFITIIPQEKLNDKKYIDEAITKNRDYATKNRTEIREYSKSFWWNHLVPGYVSLVESLIMKQFQNFTTTIVSGYFQIPSKKPHEQFYLPLVETFLKNVTQHCIFFTDVSLLERFNLISNSCVEFHAFDFNQHFQSNREFWDRQILRDTEKYHTAQLGLMWHLKKTFVLKAAEITRTRWNDPENHNYIWCDAGCIRNNTLENALRDFGKRVKITDDLFHVSKVDSSPSSLPEYETYENQIYYKFPFVGISCAIMFGKEHIWNQVEKLCNDMLMKYDQQKIPATTDQYVLYSIIQSYPQFFNVHESNKETSDLGWFRFVLEL